MEPSSKLAVRTQAAAWLARMRSERRTKADEAGFKAWLTEDARHRQAFDAVTAVFEAAGAVADLDHAAAASTGEAFTGRRKVLIGAGALALAGLGGAGVLRLTLAPALKTRIGEQRRLALADGSRVILDTNSVIKVAFTEDHRRVDLLSGRAHFDVAKDPARPFIVRAGDREVIAIGTAFDVSRENGSTSVVLVEGRVVVQPLARALSPGQTARQAMAPGDRLVFTTATTPAFQDRPDLARETAWQTGRVIFENDTLQSAVEQLNRYTSQPLVIADAQAAEMRISGVFRTGDPETFAKSVALLLPLTVAPSSDKIVLRSRRRSSDS
jgi:transmembrane sensor